MLNGLCVCPLFPTPRLPTRTRLVLFIHRIEDRKPTNTGRIAIECLANSEVFVRGHEQDPSVAFVAAPDTRPILLFPDPDAIPLDELPTSELPTTLIVPDGNWRQASKVRKRVPGLRDMPCVSLPKDLPSQYRLRSEAHATGLATVEAIARAFGILEGPHIRQTLESVFLAMVERTLWARGQLDAANVTGGIPTGVTRDTTLER
jgi:DTW domain-containing protein YfiP